MIRHLLILLPLTLVPMVPAGAATLAEALRHWTGVTPDVIGQGAHVRVDLPPGSPVPSFDAHAQAATRAGDPGWELSDIVVPQPVHLRDGTTMTLHEQHAQAWLGGRTVQARGTYAGLAWRQGTDTTRLDRATLSVDGTGGPAVLAVELGAFTTGHPTALLPQHTLLRGHTTPAGLAALTAMLAGLPSGPAPVSIDAATLDVGPARFSGTGEVTVTSPTDRQGEITISVQHFDELLHQTPLDGAAARALPALMILRQMGQKQAGRLTWTVTFAGSRVLVSGIDVGPLLGW